MWRKKLNLLAVGATEEYVENLLGTPVFKNFEGPEIWEGNEEDKPKWVDQIFSTPHAWVVTRRVKDQLESWSGAPNEFSPGLPSRSALFARRNLPSDDAAVRVIISCEL